MLFLLSDVVNRAWHDDDDDDARSACGWVYFEQFEPYFLQEVLVKHTC